MYKTSRAKLLAKNSNEKISTDNIVVAEINSENGVPPKRLRTIEDDMDMDEDMFEDQNIPASQQTQPSRTCSFLSQRHVGMRNTQSLRIQKSAPISYFQSVLMQCSINADADEIYTLSGDILEFDNNVSKVLQVDIDYPKNIPIFMDGLSKELQSDASFLKLMGSFLISHPGTGSVQTSQDSIIGNLLLIDFLRDDIFEILLDALKKHNGPNDSVLQKVCMILSSFEMIDKLNDDLFTKLFEIFDSANYNIKEIIIRKLPDIIRPQDHDVTALKLIESLPDNAKTLSSTVLNALNALNLSSGVNEILRAKAIEYLKDKPPIQYYVELIRIALIFNESEHNKLTQIINDIRYSLSFNNNKQPAAAIDACKESIFEYISQIFTKSPIVVDQWIKCIKNSTTIGSNRPIDIIILLLCVSLNDEKSDVVKHIFKNKIKKNLITESLLEETCKEYPTLIKKYINRFLEICEICFRDRDPILKAFGCSAYQMCCGIGDENMLMQKLVEFVCSTETNHTLFLPKIDLTTNSLNLLVEIKKNHPTIIQNNAEDLLRILEQVEDLTLSQYRTVMDLICSVTYPQLSDISQDQINMLVNKQIVNSKISIKKLGIIATVRVISHIVYTDISSTLASSFDSNKSYDIYDLPPEISPAAYLIKTMFLYSSASIETLALCYDELALEFLSIHYNSKSKTKIINQPFLHWFCDLLTQDLMQRFIVEQQPLPTNEIFKLAFIFNNNAPEESNDGQNIAINIGELTLKENLESISSPAVLASLLNLLRLVYLARDDGILRGIDALLGCPIVLPDLIEEVNNVYFFNELSMDNRKKVLDMLYFSANWCREIISAFSNQRDSSMKMKVLKRLSQLIKIERCIQDLKVCAPSNYEAPLGNFMHLDTNGAKLKTKKNDAPVRKKKAGPSKKPAKVNNDVEESQSSFICGTNPNTDKNELHEYISNLTFDPSFRQMDINIMLLLQEQIDLTYPFPEEKTGTCLNMFQFKFIMEDLIIKLDSLLGVGKFRTNPAQYILSPYDLVHDLINILPNIVCFIDSFLESLEPLREACNHNLMYTAQMNYLKECFGLCLRLLANLFMWPEFVKLEMIELCKAGLRIIAKDTVTVSETDFISSKNVYALRALKQIMKYKDYIFEINSSVHFYRLCKALAQYAEDSAADEMVVDVCRDFLMMKWYTSNGALECGRSFNVLIYELLQGYLHNADHAFIKKNVIMFNEEKENLKGKTSLTFFPSISKTNSSMLFDILCKTVMHWLEKNSNNPSDEKSLVVWEQGLNLWDGLLEIAKANIILKNHVIFATNSTKFIKAFMNKGISLVEKSLSAKPDLFELLKKLQKITRYLHKLCCHAKTNEVKVLVMRIPALGKLKEDVLFRVKDVLHKNGRLDLWKCENLKNKNLANEEILSQSSSSSDDDAVEEQLSDIENFMKNSSSDEDNND